MGNRLRIAGLIAGISLGLLAGCTTKVETYNRVLGSEVDKAYLSPDADFSRYTKLLPAPLEIYYAEGVGAPDPEDLERMRQIFRAAFLAEIQGVYPIVSEPAADALGVRASLVDLRSSTVYGEPPLEGRLRSLVENGQLTFLMELSDSVSGKVLARAADAEKAPDPDYEGLETGWKASEQAAGRWARLFRTFLDNNLGD